MPPPVLALVSGQALSAFLLCGTLLVIKMYVVAVITGQVRLRKKAFANPEDALRHGGLQYCRSDQDVDRCLRQVLRGLDLPRPAPPGPALSSGTWGIPRGLRSSAFLIPSDSSHLFMDPISN
ncbi:prostaglandin E synthase-like [Ailuropoda melanoleuca]|uniref:prostaglandin E synthase-like n=1 Tax=Ailuropoda melanoleuca TaxID=9646 RepID=UPI001493E724|nr:prostaglandin E synthase-like [Ailuropoda melanoleuca]